MKDYRNAEGQLHREDGPAVIWTSGTQEWYINNKRHRVDGPVLIWSNGSQEWYINGLLSRENGPAVIHANGKQVWYLNDRRHREDGPAIMCADGSQYWYINDLYHRDNGLPFKLNKFNNTMTLANGKKVPMTDDDYEKYKYKPPGQFTKAALREN